jgi:hypothetical protein
VKSVVFILTDIEIVDYIHKEDDSKIMYMCILAGNKQTNKQTNKKNKTNVLLSVTLHALIYMTVF